MIHFLFIEYKIKDENNLREKWEKALSIVSNDGEFTKNNFSIKKEMLNEIITQWQNNYPELREELEDWKQDTTRFTHETAALFCNRKSKKVECVFLRIYDSEESGTLNCINISRNYPKPSKILKVRNKIFKHKSEKIFNQMIKSHPKIIAALILSRDNGLKIIWD